jgi:hypothetical protein
VRGWGYVPHPVPKYKGGLEMSDLQSVQRKALEICIDANKQEKSSMLTGEKDLDITKEELIKRVLKINEGYLEVMEKEASILVRQGLFVGRIEKDGIYFKIPDWDAFISAVNAFYVACYAPGCDEED